MKAAIRTGFLGYTFSFVENHTKPAFNPCSQQDKSNVYVKVKSAGINPVDYKLPRMIGGRTIGSDFCGTIEKIGSGIDESLFKVGDDVFGTCSSGSLAECCVANSDNIAKKPTDWTYEECAALPVAYMSALQSLRIGKITCDVEGGNKEKSVLVIGASGGCGIAGIQLCKAMGVGRIVAICSKKNSDLVKDLGATEVVPYDDENEMSSFFTNNNEQFDCVYDAATNSGGGEDYWTMSKNLLKRDDSEECIGQYVALNGPASKWVRALSGKQKANEAIMMMKSNTQDLQLITTLLNKTGARPVINKMTFSNEGMENGFELLKSRRTKGKIVFNFMQNN